MVPAVSARLTSSILSTDFSVPEISVRPCDLPGERDLLIDSRSKHASDHNDIDIQTYSNVKQRETHF